MQSLKVEVLEYNNKEFELKIDENANFTNVTRAVISMIQNTCERKIDDLKFFNHCKAKANLPDLSGKENVKKLICEKKYFKDDKIVYSVKFSNKSLKQLKEDVKKYRELAEKNKFKFENQKIITNKLLHEKSIVVHLSKEEKEKAVEDVEELEKVLKRIRMEEEEKIKQNKRKKKSEIKEMKESLMEKFVLEKEKLNSVLLKSFIKEKKKNEKELEIKKEEVVKDLRKMKELFNQVIDLAVKKVELM